jgi:hypothetical protein
MHDAVHGAENFRTRVCGENDRCAYDESQNNS